VPSNPQLTGEVGEAAARILVPSFGIRSDITRAKAIIGASDVGDFALRALLQFGCSKLQRCSECICIVLLVRSLSGRAGNLHYVNHGISLHGCYRTAIAHLPGLSSWAGCLRCNASLNIHCAQIRMKQRAFKGLREAVPSTSAEPANSPP
jgi:hypothetical protein